MSEKKSHSISEELLFSFFRGELNKDKQTVVLSWKSESADNQQEFDRVQMFMLDIKAVGSIERNTEIAQYDVERAWKKIVLSKKKHEPSQSFGTRMVFRIAASIVLLVGIGWLYYGLQFEDSPADLMTIRQAKLFRLPDGTNVRLSKNSQLIFPRTFDSEQRRVQLIGEAYFDVTPNAKQPFVIESSEVLVQVLGTSFNVDNSAPDSVIVSVDTGRVLMSVAGSEETLTSGYRGVYYRSTELLVKLANETQSMPKTRKPKVLSFNSTPLSEVINVIQKAYNVKVNLSSPDIANCRVSMNAENESLDKVMNTIGNRVGLVWSKKNNTYLLAGVGCKE